MDNSFFIYTDKAKTIEIERLHICTWEFNDNSSLIEFGFEIAKESIGSDNLSVSLFVPWFKKDFEVKDLYEKLSVTENSRFIFNDSINETKSLDGGRNKSGVIHVFRDRNELCILPIQFDLGKGDGIINLNLNLKPYQEKADSKPNIYFRFYIKPKISYISTRKSGITKSTIIYDIKINERRNIPDEKVGYFDDNSFCKIKNCFSFTIIPNKFDTVFLDNSSLRNVRTLEYDSFNKYLGDKRVKKDDLMVVFNKKEQKDSNKIESFSFFSIYSEEKIGIGQFSLAIFLNMFCSLLFFIASYRQPPIKIDSLWALLTSLPCEAYFAFILMFIASLYFILPNNLKK